MPWEPGVALTPLPEPGKTDYLHAVLEDAVAKGARVINAGGGESHQTFSAGSAEPGGFVHACLSRRAVRPAGAGGALPRPAGGDRLRHRLRLRPAAVDLRQRPGAGRLAGDAFVNQVGRININAQCQRGPDSYPFNGRKNSAEGTLSVHDALRVFSIRTLVATRFNEANKELVDRIIRDRQSSFLTTDYIF